MGQLILPENVDHNVLIALLLVLTIVAVVAVLWFGGIKRWLSRTVEPTNGRHVEAEKRGVFSLGDQVYDIGQDIGEIRNQVAAVHGDLKAGFDRNDQDHGSLTNRLDREIAVRRQANLDINERLDRHGRSIDRQQQQLDAIEKQLPTWQEGSSRVERGRAERHSPEET